MWDIFLLVATASLYTKIDMDKFGIWIELARFGIEITVFPWQLFMVVVGIAVMHWQFFELEFGVAFLAVSYDLT